MCVYVQRVAYKRLHRKGYQLNSPQLSIRPFLLFFIANSHGDTTGGRFSDLAIILSATQRANMSLFCFIA
jgi:hypothetical protein